MNNSNYYNLMPGKSYQMILDHFKKQVDNVSPCLYVKVPGNDKKFRQGFRFISLAEEKKEDNMPKMNVIDSNEAINKRAQSQLQKDVEVNTSDFISPAQSVARPRKRKTSSKQPSTAATAAKIVKRAKDLFDN